MDTDRIALFIDNADYARAALLPIFNGTRQPDLVILVACPPRLTQRIGKWVSHRNREQWRASWSQKLFGELAPIFAGLAATKVVTEIGSAPLPAMAEQLRRTFGTDLKLLDARRPKLGQNLEPVEGGVPRVASGSLASPFAVTSGIFALLALAD